MSTDKSLLNWSSAKVGWLATAFAAFLIPVAGLWWVTAGQLDLGEWMNFGNVYEAQARSLLEGRLDVPCGTASGEAFVREGKCYVYFGIVPGLMRLPFLPEDSTHDGRRSRGMVLLANLGSLLLVGLILMEAGHRRGSLSFASYLLLAAFGTTIPTMWSWPTTYVEATSWAVCFSLGALYCLLKGWLVNGCLFAILAVFTRVSTGAGPLLAAGFMAFYRLRDSRERRRALLVLGLVALSAGGLVAYNFGRFGSPWSSIPVAMHVQYDEARLQRINGTIFHPEKAISILTDYLLHLPRFRASYPWLEFAPKPAVTPDGMDMVDPHAGVLAMMPALVWLAFAGWLTVRRTARWLLLSPLVGIALLSSVAAINQRYLHEFFLLLVPAGAFGLRWAVANRARQITTVVLSAWSIYACWALALVGQREILPWINEDALDSHRATRFRIDRALGSALPESFDYNYVEQDPPPPVKGVQVRLVNSGSVFQHDGASWRLESGPPVHRFMVSVRFAKLPAGSTPLLVAGQIPMADLISLDQSAGERYRVRIDHWGTYSEFGPEIGVEPNREYVFTCVMDRLNRQTSVWLDGTVVASRRMPLWRWSEAEVVAPTPAALLH